MQAMQELFEQKLSSLLRSASPYLPTRLALEIDELLTLPVCGKCGQRDMGQTGEYPCSECGLPTTWDE